MIYGHLLDQTGLELILTSGTTITFGARTLLALEAITFSFADAVVATPEPGTFGLFALGHGLISITRRKKLGFPNS